jgi:hypothetical protein
MMSLEQVIARLVGPAETGEGAPEPLSPAEGRALSQQLRAIVDGDLGEQGEATSDRGLAADALTLAAYLDGSMGTAERDAFEAELTRSPARRDELIAAAAWIDVLAARQEAAPADATALALALEPATPSGRGKSGAGGFAGLMEWLLPGRRLAMATSALASIAIVAVGIDVALHTNPQFRQLIETQSSPPSGPVTAPGGDGSPPIRPMFPSNAKPEQPSQPAARLGDPIVLNAETINALIAYHDDPSAERRRRLLAALVRAGSAPIPAERVGAIVLQPQLYERLTQQRNDLPTRISARFTVAGEFLIAIAN